jgi:predicted metal-dependent TIM-barrel fold hydrolase
LSRQVIALIPPLLKHPRVLGIGEIGLNKNTRNEITVFEEQVDLAAKHDQLILIHTPHLRDKHKGTSIIINILQNDRRIKPDRVIIDHCEEHTLRLAKAAGFWCGLTIYPVTKATPQRAVDMLEIFGTDRICVNSASDWGESGPQMLIDTMLEFRRRGHSEQEATKVFYNNPCRFFGQNPKWKLQPAADDKATR